MRTRGTLLTMMVLGAIEPKLLAQAPDLGKPAIQPPRLEFSPEALVGKAYSWTSRPADESSKRAGLEYVWSLPAAYDQNKSYDLLIVLHGVGKDAASAHASIDPSRLGHDMIVIAPSGTSALAQGVRSFSSGDSDFLAFREFMLDMTRMFPANRLVLCGQGRGGGFALDFASEYSSLADGVIMHRCTEHSRGVPPVDGQGGIKQVPIVVLQGTRDDPLRYLGAAAIAREFEEVGHSAVWFHELQGCGTEFDSAQVGEAARWCVAMQSEDAEEVVRTAGKMLTGAANQTGCDPGPSLGAASRLLDRVFEQTPGTTRHAPLDKVDSETTEATKKLLARIDRSIQRHIQAIEKEASKPGDYVLDGKAWLGHFVSLRADSRGAWAFEAYAVRSGLGASCSQHEAEGRAVIEALKAATPKERFEQVMDVLPRCYLMPGFTTEFLSQLKVWHAAAGDLKLSEESLERYENVLLLEKAMREGYARSKSLSGEK